jgi:hypothetical protein
MIELELPQEDYERVFRVIYTVSEAMGAKMPHSCMMFGIVGSYLLNKVYGVPARAVACIAPGNHGAGAFAISPATSLINARNH